MLLNGSRRKPHIFPDVIFNSMKALEGTTHNSHTQIFLTHGGGGTNIFAHKGGRAVQTHFDDFDIKKSDG